MDKLNPVFQPTPITPQIAANVGSWYVTETTSGYYTASELGFLAAQGWKVYLTDSTAFPLVSYSLSRRVIKPEFVLAELIEDYTAAYNEGRTLNDQRYDDLVVLYTSMLDKTEDTFNADAAENDLHKAAIEALITAMDAAYVAYAADVDGDLDAWGVSLVAEINARFDAELGRATQGLIDRGLYNGTMFATVSGGVERERTRALNDASDRITQAQVNLKGKVYNEGAEMRSRVMTAYERLRAYLSGSIDRQVAVRNAAAEALGRLVERREDGYPDLSEIGRLAASLGAGSPEAYAP